MVVYVYIKDEDGATEQIEVSLDIRAQVLATQELTKAVGVLTAAMRVGK